MPRHGHMGPHGGNEKAKDLKRNAQKAVSLHERI